MLIELSVTNSRDLFSLAENFLITGRYLNLTEEECKHPRAGEWLVEEMKNYETSVKLRMEVNLRRRIQQDNAKNPLDVIADALLCKTA